MFSMPRLPLACLAVVLLLAKAHAVEVTLAQAVFTVPDGFTVERVAGPPLVDRPITASFDEQGRLYVADSSGSNDPVQKQLAEKPHRIVRLEDRDGDGQFDHSVVFADKMMFPEGTLWHDGSLYVAAPPSIWRLTDTDGDGVADEREEWFEGKTLTGCANDLHGPYLGRDGWVYWCKGAFAEQRYAAFRGGERVSSAAHIFRRHPSGGPHEPVMVGGMDNPVDVVFSPSGERFFTTTFFQYPAGGQRDGLVHAVYGGVYGKPNGVVNSHPRTGDLMPVMAHLGPAAPCGLEIYESAVFGGDFTGNLFSCQFNLNRVQRHVLTPDGATFRSEDSDFLASTNADFHPTDVIEDADGSLLVLDTGGWYKLCCPTSQFWRPNVLGSIYRVKKNRSQAAKRPARHEARLGDSTARGLGQAARRRATGGAAASHRCLGQARRSRHPHLGQAAAAGERAGSVERRLVADSHPNRQRPRSGSRRVGQLVAGRSAGGGALGRTAPRCRGDRWLDSFAEKCRAAGAPRGRRGAGPDRLAARCRATARAR